MRVTGHPMTRIRRNHVSGVAGILIALAAVLLAVGMKMASAESLSSTLSPARFSAISSGVVLIETSDCTGRAIGQGSGFLVGETVVMTARHVLESSCGIRVRVDGEWITGGPWTSWYGKSIGATKNADIATLKLESPAAGHLFTFRTRPLSIGANVAMAGHPLGNEIQLTQGPLFLRKRLSGAPTIAVRLLGAEGASGSAFLDDSGEVVGILQRGAGSKDALGQRTAGLVYGLDLTASGWGDFLCRAYPHGGIAACQPPAQPQPKPVLPKPSAPASTPPPPAQPARSPALDVIEGWFATESSVDPAKKIFQAGAQQGRLYLIVRLNRLTNASDPASMTVRILKPDGTVFSESSYPPQNSTPFQWWSLSVNLAGPGSLAPMGGAWTAQVSVDGSQTQTYSVNVVRLPNPFDFSLAPAATFNPAYTYSIYLNWSQKQEAPAGDTFTAELISPSGAAKSTQTLSYVNLLSSGTVFLSPGYCFTSTYTNTTTCEYGTWTVNVRRSGTLIWSAGLQAGP